MAKIDRELDKLEPGDLEGHIALARMAIESKQYSRDLAHSLTMSMDAGGPDKLRQYQQAVAEMLTK